MVPGKDHSLRETTLPNVSAKRNGVDFESVPTGFKVGGLVEKGNWGKGVETMENFESLKHVASIKPGRKGALSLSS